MWNTRAVFSSEPALLIVAAGAYLVSAAWIFTTQVVLLRRLAPARTRGDCAEIVLGGEFFALVFGWFPIAAMVSAVGNLARAVGVPGAVVDAITVGNLDLPLLAGVASLLWLSAWGVISSAIKALLLRWRWRPDLPAQGAWSVAWRLSFRAYLGTALATIAIVVMSYVAP
jgi:hypothetical protein